MARKKKNHDGCLDEPPEPVFSPFVVAVDSSEQYPWTFEGYTADSRLQKVGKLPRPLIVRTETKSLDTGDYSIVGFEDKITIERKSVADFWSTISDAVKAGEDHRWWRELSRMEDFEFSAILVEGSWATILAEQPHSDFTVKSMFRSVVAQVIRYPWVHLLPMTSRWWAERAAYRLLERWWKDHAKRSDV